MTATLHGLLGAAADHRSAGTFPAHPAPPPLPRVLLPTPGQELATHIDRLGRELLYPALHEKTPQAFVNASLSSFDAFWPKFICISNLAPPMDEQVVFRALVKAGGQFGGERWADTMRFSQVSVRRAIKARTRLIAKGFPKNDEQVLAFAKFGHSMAAWNWCLFCFSVMYNRRLRALAGVRDTVREWLDISANDAWRSLRAIEIGIERDEEDAQEHMPFEDCAVDEETSALLADADYESSRLLEKAEAVG